jgi:hypothetical protein
VSTNPTVSAVLATPHGLEEILATFGDIFDYITPAHALDLRWQAQYLERIMLPFPIALSWDKSRQVNQITCQKRLAGIFSEVFSNIRDAGLQQKITSFGGCFSFRPQRTGAKLTAHSWGIAIDLNPLENAQGTAGNMDSQIIELFREAGFQWGGDWHGKSRDPMHFQFCTGY